MAAGLATLEVMQSERLIQNAADKGARLLAAFQAMASRHELVKAARGKGLMIGIEFGAPRSLALKASWNLLETANSGLFCQLIVIPLLKEHRILTQVAGHGNHTIKLIPPLLITDEDCDWIERAFDEVIADAHRVPGAVWSLSKTLIANATRGRRAEPAA
jgi:ornithine--oxo-acid transaminase